jgi:hypothetical protein
MNDLIPFFLASIFAFAGGAALAEEPLAGQDAEAVVAPAAAVGAGKKDEARTTSNASPAGPEQPRNMSGMSILGNEEAPKALVIGPWKSSELGADLDLSDTLDDRARPVDREVFMRELRYYGLRSGTRASDASN